MFIKQLSLPVLLFLFTSNLFSQRFYVKPYGGYAAGTNKRGMLLVSTVYHVVSQDSVTYVDSYNLIQSAMAKGQNYGGIIGFNPFDRIRLEIDVNFIKIDSTEYKYTVDWIFSNSSSPNVKGKGYLKFTGSMKSIAPSLYIPVKFNNLTVYSKAGGMFAKISMYRNESFLINNTLPGYLKTESYDSKYEYKEGIAKGFQFGLGAEYKLKESNLSIFTESKFSFIRFSPESAKYVKYEWQGQSIMGYLSTSEKETEYVDSYSDSDNANPDVPSKRLKQDFSFSNISFTAGFIWHIPNDIFKQITK